MHRECALEMIAHNGDRCRICKQKIGTACWMQRRQDLPEEIALIKHQQIVRRNQHNRTKFKYNNTWNRKLWPIIVASMHPHESRDVHMTFVYILQPDYVAVFMQRWLDDGGSSETFEEVYQELLWLRDNYETVPGSVKKKMRKYLSMSLNRSR